MKHLLLAYFLAFFTAGPALATPKVGDKAQNLTLVPPWTMKLCPKEFHATYTAKEALQLKRLDNDCDLWRKQGLAYATLRKDHVELVDLVKVTLATHKDLQKMDEARIQQLLTQLKKEIAEKNKYKYKPSYGWLAIAIGAGLAVTGVGFGIGVWAGK